MRFHGDLQLPEPLLQLETTSMGLGGGQGGGEVLSPVESCQHHGYLFP